jgi:hypothetical protein
MRRMTEWIKTYLKKPSKRLIIILTICFLLVALATGLYLYFVRYKETRLTKQADQFGLAGDYRKEIPVNIELFESTNNNVRKAQIAYQISIEYYQLSNIKEGRQWAQKAADLYSRSHLEDDAKQVLNDADSAEAEIKTNSATTNAKKPDENVGPNNDL